MAGADHDLRVRMAAFEWLDAQSAAHDDVLPWSLLVKGFVFQGERVPLVSQQGIFKPRILPSIPLSIRTSPEGPYADAWGPDGLLRYKYRGTDRRHPENAGLRRALAGRVPLVYFHGISSGRYVAAWPVFVVGDAPERLEFSVAVDDARAAAASMRPAFGEAATGGAAVAEPDPGGRRAYVTATFRRRLHQQAFRERVLRAYRERCSLCSLRHEELLDAAHIIPDVEPEGEPLVPNGLALCKLHHAAFDRYFLTVTPEFVVEVREEILREEDGPMLVYGLQKMHQREIALPRSRADWPDPRRLEERLRRFRAVG